MKKSETFRIILDVVSDCIEIPAGVILSSARNEEAVMARCIIATFCKDYGFSNKQIQQMLGFRSHNSVSYQLETYASRYKMDRYFHSTAAFCAHELDKEMSKHCQ